MTLNTLNTLIDDILLTIRNGHVAGSENISRYQIEQWIHSYRAFLIKQEIEKGFGIDQQYIQTLPAEELHLVSESSNDNISSHKCVLETVKALPKMVTFNHIYPVLSVIDMYGNSIQLGDRLKANMQANRKYTCNDYIAYLYGDHLRIDGPNLLDNVDIQIIAEDPSLGDCDFGDKPYPLPGDKIPTLKELIFTKELAIRLQRSSDVDNNAYDDTVREKPAQMSAIQRL